MCYVLFRCWGIQKEKEKHLNRLKWPPLGAFTLVVLAHIQDLRPALGGRGSGSILDPRYMSESQDLLSRVSDTPE